MGAVSQVKSAAVYTRISLDNDGTEQWDGLNLTRQHAIVSAIVDHVVIAESPGGGRFDPARIRPVWRL